MKHGSLFSGIGGFDLAAQWMGWDNIFHCEWNEFGQKVLKYHFPKSISYGDITKTDFTIHRGGIDILTGGFPCQPFSAAGKRKGTEDDRHLWPEMLRAIREVQPCYVVGENVRGITNWNGGLVFDQVQADLENEGFEVLPFLLPACAVNAPHRRDRVWFVAYSVNNRYNTRRGEISEKNGIQKFDREAVGCGEFDGTGISSAITDTSCSRQSCRESCNRENKQERVYERINRFGESGNASDTGSLQLQRRLHENRTGKTERHISTLNTCTHERGTWQDFPTQSPLRWGDDGLPSRLDGITFPKWRNESIKGYGNAIVPQVAFELFKVIDKM